MDERIIMAKLTKNFSDSEFACPCCGQSHMDIGFVRQLQLVRDRADIPMKIISGFRCQDYGDNETSTHKVGKAADVLCTSSHDRYNLLLAALSVFNRIGIGKYFIHFDSGIEGQKPPDSIWHYYPEASYRNAHEFPIETEVDAQVQDRETVLIRIGDKVSRVPWELAMVLRRVIGEEHLFTQRRLEGKFLD